MLSYLPRNGEKCIEKCNFCIKYFDKIECYADRRYLVFSELKPETHICIFLPNKKKKKKKKQENKFSQYLFTKVTLFISNFRPLRIYQENFIEFSATWHFIKKQFHSNKYLFLDKGWVAENLSVLFIKFWWLNSIIQEYSVSVSVLVRRRHHYWLLHDGEGCAI